QAFAVSQGYREIFARTGDTAVERIAAACMQCGSELRFQELRCDRIGDTTLRLKRANFCRSRLCPMCNWRRSLKLRFELSRVLEEMFDRDPTLRMLLLTLTEPNSSWEDFGGAIGRLQVAIGRLMRMKRIRAVVRHWFRALEVTCPRPGQFHPHFHV